MKRKDEGKIRNMKKSVGKETIKETEKKVRIPASPRQRLKRHFLPVNLIIGIFDPCR